MPVRLDWEFGEHESPPQESDFRRLPQRWRRWGTFAIVVVVCLAAGVGAVSLKVRQKQIEIEREFRAVIEVELMALQTGDRALFLDRQDRTDRRWSRAQEEAFNRYQRQIGTIPRQDRSQAVAYTGRVPDVHIVEDKGWALVEASRGASKWLEQWFYQWSPSDGWHHTRFDREWLGPERAILTQHVQLTFPERDAAVVLALSHTMDGWHGSLSVLIGASTEREPLAVEFAYRDPTMGITPQTHWARDSLTLISHSPHQGQLTADGSPSLKLNRQMASFLAEALVSQRTGVHPNQDLGPTVNALRDAIRDWAVSQLLLQMPDQFKWAVSPTPFIDELVRKKGIGIIAELSANLDHPQTLDQIFTASGIEPPDTDQRVVFFLAAADRALHDLDNFSYRDLLDPKADRNWREFHTNQLTRRRDIAPVDQAWPPPTTLRIRSVEINDDTAWVEVETTEHDGAVIRQTRFFRRANDLWLLTAPDPVYFPPMRTAQTENLSITYYEPDALWLKSDVPLALQDLIDRAAVDLGVSTDGLTITVTSTIALGLDGWTTRDGVVQVTSPSVVGWAVNDIDESLLPIGVPVMSVLFQSLIEDKPQDGRIMAVHVGAFIWELERLFPEPNFLQVWLGVNASQPPIVSLSELWLAGRDALENNPNRILISYRSLIDFLSQTYGLHVVPSLLTNISDTDDLNTWLQHSVGRPLAEIETEWESWLSLRADLK